MDDLKKENRNLFPVNFTIRALRDSRYHDTAYAVAELIDNAIEAGGERIELLCQERIVEAKPRSNPRLFKIAVLDNGSGMTARILIEALKFGGGTRHNSTRGIGKYGMGLPTSSMSQCKRVDVWTWQNGKDSAWHSYIDADEIEQGNHFVPLPDRKTPIPKKWRLAAEGDIFKNQSGTLVVWSKLDKILWRRGTTLIEHVHREVGRIHRHLLDDDSTRIRAATFRENRPKELLSPISITANDPLYLMTSTSTPHPWNNAAMFMEWCPPKIYTHSVEGKEVPIEVRYSIVKPEALVTPTQHPGSSDHGQHARHNIGVSVVRERREITLEDTFRREGGSTDYPQNRWWGCEVHFTRDCDELFGLDHNKQMVAHFTQAAKTLARGDDRARQDILDKLETDDDIIYKIVGEIRDQIRAMMRQIQVMSASRNSDKKLTGKLSPERTATRTATDADRDAINEGSEQPTNTDLDRQKIPKEKRIAGLKEQFVISGRTNEDAQQLAEWLVQEGLSYKFNPDQLDAYQMFNVRSKHGILHINLNTEHPVYSLLRHIEEDINENSVNKEEHPLFQASVAIRLLLISWARMEDQTEPKKERMRIQEIAGNWGRQVEKVFSRLPKVGS